MGDAFARDYSGNDNTEAIQALADGYLDIDLNSLFVRNRATTYRFPAPDDSIHGISPGGMLIVDRSIDLKSGRLIVVVMDGEYHIRRFKREGLRGFLYGDRPDIRPREMDETVTYHGTVTASINSWYDW